MMSPTLRSCLLALVVLNLVFVHITNAVSTIWMLPLYLGACAAPFLYHLQKHLSYRLAWNLGLMAIFALLVRHIVETGGVRFLLEDGLILAAFCQVHVLNNLSRQRRPDLIFFNSFLIAIVTSFFCQDLVYSIVFVVYATLLILGLQIAATEVRGVRVSPMRSEFRGAIWCSVVCLTFTMLAFIFLPRDFEREGLVEEQLASARSFSDMGFPEEIRMNDKSKAMASNAVVARARLKTDGNYEDVPPHWRGITYLRAMAHGWGGDRRPQHSSFMPLDPEWNAGIAGTWHRQGRGFRPLAVVEVQMIRSSNRRLFAPLGIHRFDVKGDVTAMRDGTFRLRRPWDRHSPELPYSFVVSRPRVERLPPISPRHFSVHLSLRSDAIPGAAEQLYRQLKDTVPEYAQPREVADIFSQHLIDNYHYVLPGHDGAAKNLDEFLRRKGGGHCEYFAGTMLILLRKYGVPCRMVGGYLVTEWNSATREFTIRKRHAHAWVEAWDRHFGWFTVDATPPQDSSANGGEGQKSWLALLWNRVTGFDADARSDALVWFQNALGRCWAWCKSNPLLISLLIAAFIGLVLLWRRWRRPYVDPVVADYQTALFDAGMTLRPGETPRQALARARARDLSPSKLEALVNATARHERHRYV